MLFGGYTSRIQVSSWIEPPRRKKGILEIQIARITERGILNYAATQVNNTQSLKQQMLIYFLLRFHSYLGYHKALLDTVLISIQADKASTFGTSSATMYREKEQ